MDIKTNKHLLVLTSTFPRWPNDTDPPFVFELAKRLTGHFKVTVLTPKYPGAARMETMSGLQVHRFRYFFRKYETLAGSEGILPTLKKKPFFYLLVPLFLIGELWALLEIIRRTKPDIIHAHWILPQGLIAAIAQKLTGVPYILTVHGGDIYGIKGKFSTILKGFALHNAKYATVVSKDIEKRIKQTFGENIPTEVISMGVSSQLFHPDKKSSSLRDSLKMSGPFLLFVGRLTEKKGTRYLIEAMPAVLKKFPESKLLIIGTGELAKELIRLSESLGLQDKVIFIGAIPNRELPEYFATADIFIGPSIQAKGGDTEGFGLTFVEASMSGCIVVASDVGGISDIIKDGKTGFLVKEKDPAAIAETLCTIINQIDNYSEMKNAARREMLSRFDWQVIAEKYRKILSAG
ncbi:MAG: glycosyltransferase [Deltaproteobacteria bacterium]|jgi:glycosyltransferase involved in cell wall biosynthesis|nr:glycosyltransferase [Deltaproteobacteria bacterium]